MIKLKFCKDKATVRIEGYAHPMKIIARDDGLVRLYDPHAKVGCWYSENKFVEEVPQ